MLNPLFVPSTHDFYDPVIHNIPSLILIIINCIFLTIAFLFSIYGCRLAYHDQTLHFNSSRLILMIILSWIFLLISKIFVFIFYFENDSDSEDLTFIISTPQFIYLKISAFFRYFYIFYATSAPLAGAIERTFATWFVVDYEKKRRPWIVITISTAETMFALIFGIGCAIFELSLLCVILIISFLETICMGLTVYLYYYNKKRIFILDNFHRKTQYSLSIRFQLRENIKVLKMISQIIILCIILITFIVIILIIPILLNLPPAVSRAVYTFADFCFHCNPMFVVTISTMTIPEWKAQCRKELGTIFGIDNNQTRVETMNPRPLVVEADVYFSLFEKAMGSGTSRKC